MKLFTKLQVTYPELSNLSTSRFSTLQRSELYSIIKTVKHFRVDEYQRYFYKYPNKNTMTLAKLVFAWATDCLQINKERFLKIRSKNLTAKALKNVIPTGNKRVVLRLGSTTPLNNIFRGVHEARIQEINTIEACILSNHKKNMKIAFDNGNVITAKWKSLNDEEVDNWNHFPAIIKHIHSSKGKGIYYINNSEELFDFINTHNRDNYIVEEYLSYVKEYRLHVTQEGCFYTCRKMLRSDAQERWHRHASNSVWILEENPLFDKPSNWNDIVAEAVKALKAVGLDIGAIDIKVQSSRYANPKFIILETNSAPSLGKITKIKYLEILPTLIK